jgi:hypothetical protein
MKRILEIPIDLVVSNLLHAVKQASKSVIICGVLVPASLIAKPTTTVTDLQQTKNSTHIPNFVSKLPKCKGTDPKGWNDCVGGFTYPNKNAYFGEWRKGRREGVGQLKIVAKGNSDEAHIKAETTAIYVGEFEHGQLNGHGVWIEENGDRFEGEFVNNILIQDNQTGATVFGDDTDKFRKKCESYGLKFGTSEFAKCMLTQEKMANKNAQRNADRETKKEIQRNNNAQREADRKVAAEKQQSTTEPSAIDWFRLANEFAKPPQWIPDSCPSVLNARPGQYPGCN